MPTPRPQATASPPWFSELAPFARPHMRKALWQLANTFIPYVILWVLMIQSVLHGYHYGITLALAALAGCLLVRIFIFFHDACHASFFASRKANQILGYITGVLTFTPFRDWQKSHIKHHGTAGDLDNRGSGDVWTMTVEEYQSAPWTRRLAYRLYRNPLILFGLGPAYMFLVSNRFPKKHAGKKERRSVLITNVSLLVLIVVASWTMGFWTYVKIQVPVLLVAGTIGIWLFYVQHQFQGVYWARHEDRDQIKVALQGSSHYKLPALLQWITGNIGLHHVHHMYPRIPNYNLQECYEAIKPLQEVRHLTLGKSLHCLRMRLWDEANQRLVGFSEASKLNASGVKN